MKSAQQGTEKWQRKLAAAAPDYRTGVQNTSKDPTAAAAASVGVWSAKVSSADARDKYVRKLQGVSKGDWQKAASDGADRLASGATKGAPKYAKAAANLYPAIAQAVASLPQKQTGSVEEGIARASAFIRAMAAYKG